MSTDKRRGPFGIWRALRRGEEARARLGAGQLHQSSAVSDLPADCPTLVHVLRWRAAHEAERNLFTFLLDGETQEMSLTYAELDRRARAIAAHLQSIAKPGERALVVLPSGLDYPAAFFGCLYAGVVPVPSTPPRPDKGAGPLETSATVTGATLALTTSALRSALGASLSQSPELSRVQWVAVDTIPGGAEQHWREPAIDSSSLAAFLLTSGSTSLPKAIMCSHTTFMTSMALLRTLPRCPTAGSHLLHWMPPHAGFSLNIGIVYPVYAAVPTTSMATAAFLERPVRWLQAISRLRATHSIASNFAFDLCTQTVSPEERSALDLSCWETVMNGGELVRADTVETFVTTFAQCGLRRDAHSNAYGMSEAVGMIAFGPAGQEPKVRAFATAALEQHRVLPAATDAADAQLIVSAGQPSVPDHVLIVDPETSLRCPDGRVGEIWVSGPLNPALGYLNQPEETTRTFQAHLADTGEGPFLRTGDLGFFYEGEVFIVGRVKELIIIRGRNLSPQPIELTAEQSHPALRPGSTAAFSIDVDNEERLVVVQEVEPTISDPAEVMAAIRHAVAAQHEIQPYAVVLIPSGTLPRTGSGKVQRQPCRKAYLEGRLVEVARSVLDGGARPDLARAYVAPRTPAEETLAQIWSQVLRVERVGIHDNFFELGGDSLTSMQVIARARRAGVHFTVEQLVEYQTIARLAPSVRAAPTLAAEQGLVTGTAPLLPTQQRFFELQVPDYYHIGFYRQLTARERLNPEWLSQAMHHLIAHHDGLRMRFLRDDGGWRQVDLESETHHVFSYVDLSWLSREEQAAAVSAAGDALHQTLDLATGPLVRVALFDLGPDTPSALVMVVHHLVVDAYSHRILLEDLETAYRQLSRGEEVRLPAKTVSLKGWAERLEAYAQSAELRQQLDYWLAEPRKHIDPLPNSAPGGWGGSRATQLSLEETATLIYDVPKRYGTEINDVLLTALVHAFAEWTGSRRLLVDLVSHGRDPLFPDMDLSRTVGWLATFFPVLLDLGQASGPAEELQAIKEQLRRIPTRGLGYGVLRYVSRDRALVEQLAALAQPQVRFNYAGTFGQTTSDADLFSVESLSSRHQLVEGEIVAIPDGGEEPELLVSGQILHGHLRILVQFGTVVTDPATMDQLAHAYVGALQAIIATCRSPQPEVVSTR